MQRIDLADQIRALERTHPSSENPYSCEKCRDTGWAADNNRFVKRCGCVAERRVERKRANVPPKYRGVQLNTIDPRSPSQKKALQVILKNPGGSYFLWGDTGSGKTHLLVAQYLELAKTKRCLLATTGELLEDLRREKFEEFIAPAQGLKDDNCHLFWDDADKMKVTDFKDEVVFHLVNRLTNHGVGMTISSNLNLKDLVQKLGPVVVRRIDDHCKVMEL